MVNYVYRVHYKTTLCCSNLILSSSLSLPKCLAILISPFLPADCFSFLKPVLARTLEQMFNLDDDYYFQLTNSSCLAFQNVNALSSPE